MAKSLETAKVSFERARGAKERLEELYQLKERGIALTVYNEKKVFFEKEIGVNLPSPEQELAGSIVAEYGILHLRSVKVVPYTELFEPKTTYKWVVTTTLNITEIEDAIDALEAISEEFQRRKNSRYS